MKSVTSINFMCYLESKKVACGTDAESKIPQPPLVANAQIIYK
jgi:hypothetical protein